MRDLPRRTLVGQRDEGGFLDTRRKLTGRFFGKWRDDTGAVFILERMLATGMKDTARRRRCRTRNIAGKNDTLGAARRVRMRHGGKQRARVRVTRLAHYCMRFAQLDNTA